MSIDARNDQELYAVPGANSIIDTINPVTGLTRYFGRTEAEVRELNPGAERMTWDAWTTAASARQRTPITWGLTTAKEYRDMLNVLPPALWIGGAFLVGEPMDRNVKNGQPRFTAYRRVGSDSIGWRHIRASRPLTGAELREQLGLRPSNQIDYIS